VIVVTQSAAPHKPTLQWRYVWIGRLVEAEPSFSG
jgi:hypothetical protein